MASKFYDVFLSFNSEDRNAVEKIAVYLKEKIKLRPWFDQWELIPGEPWVRNLERGLTASSTCAVFVGQSGEGPWQKREVETALRQQVDKSDFRVIPVLLPDAPKQPELPLFLTGNMWVDFRRKDLDDDDALWRLECGIRGIPPGQGRPKTGDGEKQPITERRREDTFAVQNGKRDKDRDKTNATKTILILAANPKDTSPLRLDEEVREIDDGLRRSKNREQFVIHQRWAVRLKDLRRALLDCEPQIVHFCGHGKVSGIMLEHENGNSILVDPNALAELFKLFSKQVECVLLNACYSEDQANAISQHINYVIGMRQGIEDKAAIEFATGFYDALGAGKDYEEAFSFGCNAIQLYNLPDYVIPVLKRRSPSSVLPVTQDEVSNSGGLKPNDKIEQQPSSIEFVNRANELQFITNIYCPPYLLISAPAGYGKSRLVEYVKDRLQEQDWLCVHLKLSREKAYSLKQITTNILQQLEEQQIGNLDLTTPEKCGFEIGKYILKILKDTQRNVLLLIDETEALHEKVVKQLLNQCIPTVKEKLSISETSIRFRLICVGRHLAPWKQWESRIPLELMSLTPFDFPAVHQTVEHFASKSDINTSFEYQQDFAAHLMHFTGGHPECMVKILRKDYGSPISLMISNEHAYYGTVMKPVIEKIQTNIPSSLQQIFEKLSVIRMYNYPLLQKIIDKGIIRYPGSAGSLEGELTETYLVERKQGFIQGDIVRRLFAIKLRNEGSKETFIELCGKAEQVFEEYLKETTYNPHSVALEGLYQELQLGYYQSDQTPEARKAFYKRFFAKDGILRKYLDLLANKPDIHDISANFLQLLQDREDWEFQFTLNFFLRKEHQYTDEPYQYMLREVKGFFEEQGGNHA